MKSDRASYGFNQSQRPINCQLCGRKVALTFHHLIPRQLHRRNHFRKHYNREFLNRGVFICRQCHSVIHKKFPVMELAKELNTLERLKANTLIARHCQWLAKQRTGN